MKREAEEGGYDIDPTIRPNLQVPGQQFQQSGKLAARTVDPKTGWVLVEIIFSKYLVTIRLEGTGKIDSLVV